jgi:hypothetical protein
MKRVSQRRKGRNSFSFDAKRRNEIERLAKHVGAADTEDFERFLIAWYWHNPQSKDPLWSLMYAASRMGGSITEAEASAITEEASIMRRYRKPDPLARFLGLKYAVRQQLQIRTIGSIDVGKKARTVLRKRKAAKRQEAIRRANGARPRAEYEANSQSAKWRKLGMSKPTYYRKNMHRTKGETGPCAMSFLPAEDTPVSLPETGVAEAGLRPASKQEVVRLATATIGAADIHVRVPNWCFGRKPPVADEYTSLPTELRLLALGLPISTSENFRAAA